MAAMHLTHQAATPGSAGIPPGWNTEWSTEHNRFYYMNVHTGESTWDQPTVPAQPQRKPVPNRGDTNTTSVASNTSASPEQVQYLSAPHSQVQYQHSQLQVASQVSLVQPQPEPARYFPPPLSSQVQYQQRQAQPSQGQYFPPPPSRVQYQSGQPQPMQASPAPYVQGQQYRNLPAQSPQAQINNYQSGVPTPIYTDRGQQSPSLPNHASYQFQQPQQPQMSTLQVSQGQAGQKKSGSMMGKLSDRFGQLRESAASIGTGPPGSANSKSNLKKWGTRAAVGLGAIGAVALGVDMMDGSLFDGAAAADGGSWMGLGDGGVSTDGMADSSMMAANETQLAMEAVGQQNSLNLLDPVGTTYETVLI